MPVFSITHQEGKARRGQIQTEHGTIETPAFVPCATHGSLRGVPIDRVGELGLELILSNIYHLMLRPGITTIERLGGIHQFMGWGNAIITDSGGFQAFALPKYVRFREEGITFRSHIDGSTHLLTPESVIEMQERIGVDIGTCLDVCTGFPVPERDVAQAVDQTNRWAERSVAAWTNRTMLLYGMVQGSIYESQRRRSAEFLRDLPFGGFAIGGNMYTFGQTLKALAAEKPRMWEVVGYTASLLPEDKPRHLLGVGEPSDLIAGVGQGIDTFDCVMATRIARHGTVWVRIDDTGWKYRRENLKSAANAQSSVPIDERCLCVACTRRIPRGYLRHLLVEHDPIAAELLSLHNLVFLRNLIADIRASLEAGTFVQQFGQIDKPASYQV
ncbi:tRNA guanosine(34) transglycosylase Tgt [Candidatus Berkelbacteria bacterium]|nr:tRNA guanosine(34) transglycosylase Tgt [Candidatus Berkelbacteria bacterium]